MIRSSILKYKVCKMKEDTNIEIMISVLSNYSAHHLSLFQSCLFQFIFFFQFLLFFKFCYEDLKTSLFCREFKKIVFIYKYCSGISRTHMPDAIIIKISGAQKKGRHENNYFCLHICWRLTIYIK